MKIQNKHISDQFLIKNGKKKNFENSNSGFKDCSIDFSLKTVKKSLKIFNYIEFIFNLFLIFINPTLI